MRSLTPSAILKSPRGSQECPLRKSLLNELDFMTKWAQKAEEPKSSDHEGVYRQLKGLIRRLRRSLSLTKCVYH